MSLHHSREELLREVRNMPDKMFEDGVLVDCPRRRRREQVKQGFVRVRWPREQSIRFAAQLERYIGIFTKDIALEVLLRKLEAPTDEELRQEAE